jgi:hypothetical protein
MSGFDVPDCSRHRYDAPFLRLEQLRKDCQEQPAAAGGWATTTPTFLFLQAQYRRTRGGLYLRGNDHPHFFISSSIDSVWRQKDRASSPTCMELAPRGVSRRPGEWRRDIHSRRRPTIAAAGGGRGHVVSALRGRVGHLRATAPETAKTTATATLEDTEDTSSASQ